jgi:hypothetical protein
MRYSYLAELVSGARTPQGWAVLWGWWRNWHCWRSLGFYAKNAVYHRVKFWLSFFFYNSHPTKTATYSQPGGLAPKVWQRTRCDGCGVAVADAWAIRGRLLCPLCKDEELNLKPFDLCPPVSAYVGLRG